MTGQAGIDARQPPEDKPSMIKRLPLWLHFPVVVRVRPKRTAAGAARRLDSSSAMAQSDVGYVFGRPMSREPERNQ
jgi:hypothetical protein